VQEGVDEKLSSIKLEEETAKAFEGFTCIFTVVQDIIIGLECTEHTPFNMIFVNEGNAADTAPYDLLRSLRMVGSRVPVVLLARARAASSNAEAKVGEGSKLGLPPIGFGAEPSMKFTAVLKQPYTKRDLCDVIRASVFCAQGRSGGEDASRPESRTDMDQSQDATTSAADPSAQSQSQYGQGGQGQQQGQQGQGQGQGQSSMSLA
jgi:hypothetical protein